MSVAIGFLVGEKKLAREKGERNPMMMLKKAFLTFTATGIRITIEVGMAGPKGCYGSRFTYS